MATDAEVSLVREYAEIPLEDSPLNDRQIEDLITREGSVYLAASSLWRRRAAAFSGLADITESGSSRKMSGLYKGALEMASTYAALDVNAIIVTHGRRPSSRPIVREDVR